MWGLHVLWCQVSDGGCWVRWLKLPPGAGEGFGAENSCSGSGLEDPSDPMGEPQSTISWRWDPLDGALVETCVCFLGSHMGTGRWGAMLGTVPWLGCRSQAGVCPQDSWTLFAAMP